MLRVPTAQTRLSFQSTQRMGARVTDLFWKLKNKHKELKMAEPGRMATWMSCQVLQWRRPVQHHFPILIWWMHLIKQYLMRFRWVELFCRSWDRRGGGGRG